MGAVQSGSTTRTTLDEMEVFLSLKPSDHPGFLQSTTVGQFMVAKNRETGAFEPYDGSEDKPKFPKIINSKPGRVKLPEATQEIGEYVPYYEKKQEYFARWICDYYQKNLQSNSNSSLPNFICFGSRLADALITPCKYRGDWDFHAAKIQNSIFLWADPQFFQQHLTTNLGYGFAFEAIMTGSDPTNPPMVSMSKKPFAVHRKEFGKYSFLLASDIDAEDDEGNWVELKIFEERYVKGIDGTSHPLDKALRCWSQCVISDSKRVIIGQNKEGYLTDDIRDRNLYNFEKMIKISKADRNLCYEFLDRLLAFIDKQFDVNGAECCLQFLWDSKEEITVVNGRQKHDRSLRKVKCVKAPAELIPEWFINICTILK